MGAGKRPWQVLNGNALKMLACVTMLIDHIGAVFIYNGVIPAGGLTDAEYAKWELAYEILRTVGRMAFPIYCFLLVEGFLHTRDWRRYAARLAVFAVIAEAPFDLAIAGRIPYWGDQSVMVSLLIGVFMMAGLRFIEEREAAPFGILPMASRMLVVGLAAMAAVAVKSDYVYMGIVLIAILYIGRSNRDWSYLAGAAWVFLYFSDYLPFRVGTALAFLPIALYNGGRGKWKMKYVFYWFYPAHLTALYLLTRMWLNTA